MNIKSLILSVLFSVVIVFNSGVFALADLVKSPYSSTFRISDDASSESNYYHALMYGTTIQFVEGTIDAVRVSRPDIISIQGSTLKAVGHGRCNVDIVSNGQNHPYAFFVWNVKLKGGQVDVFSDSACTNKVGTLYGETYLLCTESGSSLKIDHYLHSSGHTDVDLLGKYIVDYRNNSSKSVYFDYGFNPSQRILHISLKSFNVVKPVMKSTAMSTEQPSSQTASDTSTFATNTFLDICSKNIKYLYDNDFRYSSTWGMLELPPYGSTPYGAPKGTYLAVNDIDYVRWCLYEYGKIKGVSSLINQPATMSSINAYYDLAISSVKTSVVTDWMEPFTLVYVASNQDTGLGREPGMTPEKIKQILKPGDIMVHTGGPTFYDGGYGSHIDIFAGFTGKDSSGRIGVYTFCCYSAPRSETNYKDGKPLPKIYATQHESDAHGFWDLTAVLRLNV